MDPDLSPSLAEAPYLSGEGSFPVWVHTANKETDTGTETAQALFNGQRMEKWELSLQIKFSWRVGGDQGKILKVS